MRKSLVILTTMLLTIFCCGTVFAIRGFDFEVPPPPPPPLPEPSKSNIPDLKTPTPPDSSNSNNSNSQDTESWERIAAGVDPVNIQGWDKVESLVIETGQIIDNLKNTPSDKLKRFKQLIKEVESLQFETDPQKVKELEVAKQFVLGWAKFILYCAKYYNEKKIDLDLRFKDAANHLRKVINTATEDRGLLILYYGNLLYELVIYDSVISNETYNEWDKKIQDIENQLEKLDLPIDKRHRLFKTLRYYNFLANGKGIVIRFIHQRNAFIEKYAPTKLSQKMQSASIDCINDQCKLIVAGSVLHYIGGYSYYPRVIKAYRFESPVTATITRESSTESGFYTQPKYTTTQKKSQNYKTSKSINISVKQIVQKAKNLQSMGLPIIPPDHISFYSMAIYDFLGKHFK